MGFKDRLKGVQDAAKDAAEKAKKAAGAFKKKVSFTPSTVTASSSRASREMTGSTGIESTSSSPATPGNFDPTKTKNRSNSTSSNPQEPAHIEQIIAGYNKTNEESYPEKLYYCSEKTIHALQSVTLAEKTAAHPDLTSEQLIKNEIYDHLLRGTLVLNKALREKKTEDIIIALAEKSNYIQGYRNDAVGDGNQQLIIFFQNIVDSMKADYTDNLLGKLNDARTQTKQEGIEGTEIKKPAKALQAHYSQCIEKFNEEEFKAHPEVFIGKACLLLNDYYCEILKLKLEKKNRFNDKPVQAALEFYFEQRKQLYEMVLMTQPAVEADSTEQKILLQKSMLLDKFKIFIKKTYANDQVYEKTLGVSHGPSKWARINTAHEMYLKHGQLPGDILHPLSDKIVETLRYVSEVDDELKTLKCHGLFFGYGKEQKADLYTPLNGLFPIEPLPVDPSYSPSLNL